MRRSCLSFVSYNDKIVAIGCLGLNELTLPVNDVFFLSEVVFYGEKNIQLLPFFSLIFPTFLFIARFYD